MENKGRKPDALKTSEYLYRILSDAQNGAKNSEEFARLVSGIMHEYYGVGSNDSTFGMVKETPKQSTPKINSLEESVRTSESPTHGSQLFTGKNAKQVLEDTFSRDDSPLIREPLPSEIETLLGSYNAMCPNVKGKYDWNDWLKTNNLENYTIPSRNHSASATYRSHNDIELEKGDQGLFTIREENGKGYVFVNPIVALEQAKVIEYVYDFTGKGPSAEEGRIAQRIVNMTFPATVSINFNKPYILTKKGLLEVEPLKK
ncbi:MAG: hypothetical protein AABW50_01130 [Nanoarchaeota archaeon]